MQIRGSIRTNRDCTTSVFVPEVEDVDQAYEFISNELNARIIRAPKIEDHYAAGYYSILLRIPGVFG